MWVRPRTNRGRGAGIRIVTPTRKWPGRAQLAAIRAALCRRCRDGRDRLIRAGTIGGRPHPDGGVEERIGGAPARAPQRAHVQVNSTVIFTTVSRRSQTASTCANQSEVDTWESAARNSVDHQRWEDDAERTGSNSQPADENNLTRTGSADPCGPASCTSCGQRRQAVAQIDRDILLTSVCSERAAELGRHHPRERMVQDSNFSVHFAALTLVT